ncbi:MAG: SMC-Scp complex subunit ScpB [Bacilli bacterium]
MVNYVAVIEGLLFLKGDEGASVKEICYCLEVPENEILAYIEQLKNKYMSEDSGLCIHMLNENYRIMTKSDFATYYSKILENPITQKLSNAALETLAIIAYKQPITRAEVSDVRGVNSDGIMKSLTARNLIYESGVLEAVGKPILYNTTNEFLDLFNLSDLDELPSIDNFLVDEEVEYGLFDLRFNENESEEKFEDSNE